MGHYFINIKHLKIANKKEAINYYQLLIIKIHYRKYGISWRFTPGNMIAT